MVAASANLEPRLLGRRDLTRFNTFEFWSRKLERDVLLLGPSQFDASLILEFDHEIQRYCERPPLRIDILPHSEKMARELDFWAERSNGQQFGIIVFDARPKLTE